MQALTYTVFQWFSIALRVKKKKLLHLTHRALSWPASPLSILFSHHMPPNSTQSQETLFHFLEPTVLTIVPTLLHLVNF